MGGALWKQNSTPQKGSALKLYLAQRNRAPKSVKSIPCPPVNNSARSLPLLWRGHGEAGMQLVIWGEAFVRDGCGRGEKQRRQAEHAHVSYAWLPVYARPEL